MKILAGKFEITEHPLANPLTIIVGDDTTQVEVNLIAKMSVEQIRHALEGAGIKDPQLTADTEFCRVILAKEKGFTAQNISTPIA